MYNNILRKKNGSRQTKKKKCLSKLGFGGKMYIVVLITSLVNYYNVASTIRCSLLNLRECERDGYMFKAALLFSPTQKKYFLRKLQILQ